MKKLQPVLHYALVSLCFPIVVLILRFLDSQNIIVLNPQKIVILYMLVSTIIGLWGQWQWPIDWLLAIILPFSLTAGYFCIGLCAHIYDISKPFFNVRYAISIVTVQPLWLYAAATLPGLLTSFLCKFVKPRWLRFICIGALLLASVFSVMPFGIRYYSPQTVSRYVEKHELGCFPPYTAANITEKGILTTLHSSDFKKCTVGVTTEADAKILFGKPHAVVGSGYIRNVYFTVDSQLVLIGFGVDTVSDVLFVHLE